MPYTIRPAECSDIDALMRIEAVSFSKEICESRAVFAERLKYAAGYNFVLCSGAIQSVCGYLTSELWASHLVQKELFTLNHSAAQHCKSGTVLYISSFAVLPALRGKKIETEHGCMSAASYLFRTALQNIVQLHPQITRILLMVNEQWIAAVRMYEAHGFSLLKEFPAFSGFGGSRALIYEKAVYPGRIPY